MCVIHTKSVFCTFISLTYSMKLDTMREGSGIKLNSVTITSTDKCIPPSVSEGLLCVLLVEGRCLLVHVHLANKCPLAIFSCICKHVVIEQSTYMKTLRVDIYWLHTSTRLFSLCYCNVYGINHMQIGIRGSSTTGPLSASQQQ